MRRHLLAAIAAMLFTLCVAGTAAASGLGDPVDGQSNDSEQGQAQIVPIAPQANVQNVNVGSKERDGGNTTSSIVDGNHEGSVEQGDANNANTGQANQQENTQETDGGKSQTDDSDQKNKSDQDQVQVVPIAPQANVQNVNVATQGDVEQGNANNANTGQANQQENTTQSGSGGREHSDCGCDKERSDKHESSNGGSTSQSNRSEQEQIQVVPIAPQANVQNVNVATQGDVDQGNANNANTGQANQQENTAVAGRGDDGKSWDGRCEKDCSKSTHESSHGSTSQSNRSEQEQIQIVPIAPQLNLQNVNVATYGDVEQGNADNANTGQANQQSNTAIAGRGRDGKPGDGGIWTSGLNDGKCDSGCYEPTKWSSAGSSVRQSNWNDQEQFQFIPIAPQLNVQNVNVLTFGDVEQGNANNANTGQANQQSNSSFGSRMEDGKGGRCYSRCDEGPKPESRSDGPRCKPKHESEREPRCKHERKSDSKPRCTSREKRDEARKPGGQSNWNRQKQFQFIPIAPQANVQNVNVLTFGDVEQGNANNANTGQANQQSNTIGSPNHERREEPAPPPVV